MTNRLLTRLSLIVALLTTSCFGQPEPAQGSLVIVGGGLRASNEAVYQAFIERANGGQIGIIPAASGKPTKSAHTFRDTLVSYGVDEQRIQIIPIAWRDDSTTDDVDESTWRKNAWKEDVTNSIAGLSAVWFTGGDQSRIISALVDEDWNASPSLYAIRKIYQDGAVIGGTSAGAAIQSETMILGGTSLQAFDYGTTHDYPGMESQENGPLVLGGGLGFFPHGIIDQHFDRKARLGRLIVALLDNVANQKIGYGIDEDTALVFDSAQSTATVLGAGTVVAIDASDPTESESELSGIRISVLGSGDTISFPVGTITINPHKEPIKSEYLSLDDTHLSSLFSPYSGRLEEALGFMLLDNAKDTKLETRVPIASGGERLITFTQTDNSEGYWGYLDGQRDSYSILEVSLSISPPPPANATKQ